MGKVTFEMDGRNWTLPTFNLRELKEIARLMTKLREIHGDPFSPEHIDIPLEIIFTGLYRTYPDVKKAELEEWLDAKNVWDIAAKVADGGGFTRPRPKDN